MKSTIFFAFIISQALSVALAWLGGYDFDRRGGDVAIAIFASIVFGVGISIIAALVTELIKDSKRYMDIFDNISAILAKHKESKHDSNK